MLVDGQVMGFTLARMLGSGKTLVDSHAIHPVLRGRWASLWLKFAGVCACRDAGVRTILFYSYAHHTDTQKLSRKSGTVIRELIEPYVLLEALRPAAAPTPNGPGDHTPEPP
jgi:hypothetical protein